jgi:hypothetical protein
MLPIETLAVINPYTLSRVLTLGLLYQLLDSILLLDLMILVFGRVDLLGIQRFMKPLLRAVLVFISFVVLIFIDF